MYVLSETKGKLLLKKANKCNISLIQNKINVTIIKNTQLYSFKEKRHGV